MIFQAIPCQNPFSKKILLVKVKRNRFENLILDGIKYKNSLNYTTLFLKEKKYSAKATSKVEQNREVS